MKRTLKSNSRMAPAPRLPDEPSLIIDDRTQMQAPRKVSQNEQQQQQAPTNRRPKFIMTEEAVEQALQLVTHSKVNSKNAWDVKLIEGMQASVDECLGLLRLRRSGENRDHGRAALRVPNQQTEGDAYAQFSRAATLVEGGAKVWGHRVESTYLLSNQLVRRLLRNTEEEKEDKENEETEDPHPEQTQRTKKKRTLERTLAETADEINLEDRQCSKANAISVMARAMIEKFDHSHAQGLLLNNVPSGIAGNLILDRDDAKMDMKAPGSNRNNTNTQSRTSGSQRGSGNRRASAQLLDPFYLFEDENAEDLRCDDVLPPSMTTAAPVSDQGESRPFVVDQEAIIQNASQQAVPFVGTPHRDEIVIDNDEIIREQSVFSAADFDAMNGEPLDDDNDNDAHFSDARELQYDDEVPTDAEADEYYASKSVAEAARGLVLGQFEQETLHKRLALLAECPAGSAWVPLSQETAHLHGRGGAQASASSALLSRIRKQCIAPSGALPRGGDDSASAQPNAKKRRTEKTKTVKFSCDVLLEDQSANNDDEILNGRLRLNKTPFTAMSKLGKMLAPAAVFPASSGTSFSTGTSAIDGASLMAFQNPQTCEDKSVEHRIANRDVIEKFSFFVDGPAALENASYGAPLPVFLEWCPNSRESITDVLRLYQPFATASSEWSLLRKTNNSMASKMLQGGIAGDGQAKNIIKRHSFGQGMDDAGGGRQTFDDEEIVAELPVDLFDQEDADDAPDNDLLNIPLAMELPQLSFGGSNAVDRADERIQLIAGPETIKVLKINQATISTQVDVGRLRSAMWTTTAALCPAKRHVETASRKRQRDGDYEEDEETQNERFSQQNPGGTFANVVANVLPQVPRFTKEGTLSPAFFFFSLLFLANEHGLRLQGGDLSDVKIFQ